MSCAPTNIPYCFIVGEKYPFRADFTASLDESETLIGTPTVEEIGSSTLAISTPNVNSLSYVRRDNGETVASGKAVTANIEIIKASKSPTVIRVTCNTTNSKLRLSADYQLRTKV